jgi:hypothetical protein
MNGNRCQARTHARHSPSGACADRTATTGVVEEELGYVEVRGGEAGREAGAASAAGEVGGGHGGGGAARRRRRRVGVVVVVQHWARSDCRHGRVDRRRGSFVLIVAVPGIGELPLPVPVPVRMGEE